MTIPNPTPIKILPNKSIILSNAIPQTIAPIANKELASRITFLLPKWSPAAEPKSAPILANPKNFIGKFVS